MSGLPYGYRTCWLSVSIAVVGGSWQAEASRDINEFALSEWTDGYLMPISPFHPGDLPMNETESTGPITTSIHDDDDMIEIVDMFIDELPDRVTSLMTSLEQEEWSQIKTLSHQLKGAAPGYGFESIGEAAGVLEGLVKDSAGVEEIQQASDRLVSLCNRVTKL